MNVFGNAMKYTGAGCVLIHLEATESSGGRRRQPAEDSVTLTVSDTGKGVPGEFLRGRLFTPFAQEDTLAVGTGLGLSIVRSLVKAMNGSIDLHSRPEEGTIVKIALPLTRPGDDVEVIDPTTIDSQLIQPAAEKDIVNDCDLLRHNHAKWRAAILGMEPTDTAIHPMWSIISHYLTDWYGFGLVSWTPRPPVDILLTNEHMLAVKPPSSSTTPLPPLLIICSRATDYSNQCQIDLPEDRTKDAFDVFSDIPDLTDATSPNASGLIESTPSQQGRRTRVLVVDDNSINLNLMFTFMKKRQPEILYSAENGQLAVDAVEQLPQGYDLIFMDISMTVMNGFEATRAIRAIEKERGSGSTPAVIISSCL
ncbi:hypothetical protein BDW59DRAFT_158094 [Aspergillus cavernicola]|uniref:histidine kinase n=1 Tax=Aspergillus cavernicola TaxID=176166 RepID=A0ABR4IV71_9EURO